MENNKRNNTILLIVFLIVIYVPSISYFFAKDAIEVNNNENRELSKKPNLSFKEISDYPKKFDSYYNDNLPYRNYIINVSHTLYYNFFHESMDDRIIIGKNEKNEIWLFYDNINDHDEISFIDGRKKY